VAKGQLLETTLLNPAGVAGNRDVNGAMSFTSEPDAPAAFGPVQCHNCFSGSNSNFADAFGFDEPTLRDVRELRNCD